MANSADSFTSTIKSDILIVSKTRTTLDGESITAYYACGQVRASIEEATADARLFSKLPELRANIAQIADPDNERWRGVTVLRMFRQLLGLDD